MGIYLVSVNLTQNGTYADRYENLLAEIQRGPWWAETGSLMVCESDETIDSFCDRIFAPWTFDETGDTAVVFDLESGEGRSKGRFHDLSLYNIVPWVKRL